MATEFKQAGLFSMKLKLELLEPLSRRIAEALRIGLSLEADNNIVGTSHDIHQKQREGTREVGLTRSIEMSGHQ